MNAWDWTCARAEGEKEARARSPFGGSPIGQPALELDVNLGGEGFESKIVIEIFESELVRCFLRARYAERPLMPAPTMIIFMVGKLGKYCREPFV